METRQIPKINPEFINNVFRNIEARNNHVVEKIQEEKKEFDEKIDKIIKFVQFRSKIDKLESAYNLLVDYNQIKEIKKLTQETKDKLFTEALKRANGNKKKAIALLFDPSSDISI